MSAKLAHLKTTVEINYIPTKIDNWWWLDWWVALNDGGFEQWWMLRPWRLGSIYNNHHLLDPRDQIYVFG